MKLGFWILFIAVLLIFFGKFIIPMLLGMAVSVLILAGIAALIIFAMKML
jgi:hypothetical protein